MPSPPAGELSSPPLVGELRYGLELARLLSDRHFLRPRARAAGATVLLVPGFMAGDASLNVLAAWLRRLGALTSRSGMVLNTNCGERAVAGIEARLETAAERAGRSVVLIGQSRGGALARVVAVRRPDLIGALVMLGSPVLDPLAVGAAVLGTVRSVAWLGDRGVPGMFSARCGDGPCCEKFREDLQAPLDRSVHAVSVYSRSDGIVDWRACLDPHAEHVEVRSSHTGMSVNPDVYRVIARVLDEEGDRWTG